MFNIWSLKKYLLSLLYYVEILDKFIHVICNHWSASYIDITGCIEDIDHFALKTIYSLIEPIWQFLLRNIALLIFEIVGEFMQFMKPAPVTTSTVHRCTFH